MDKISLKLDDLRVHSFVTSEPAPQTGTVNAHEQQALAASYPDICCNTRYTCSSNLC